MARHNAFTLDRPPGRICLFRLSAIGDCCHVVPVIRTLQTAFPDTHLTWILGAAEASLFQDLDGVEIIAHNKKAGRRGLARQLAGRSFDVLMLMQVALRAGLASRAVKAPCRLGFDQTRSRDGHRLFINARIPDASPGHVIDGFFDFLKPLSLTDPVMRWDIPIPARARRHAQQLIDDRPVLIISPCSSQRLRNYRNWRLERYVALARHAIEVHAMQVMITGAPGAESVRYAEAIEQACAGLSTPANSAQPVTNLVGQTDLKTLFALIDQATAVVAPDSGPVHLAAAAGTPAIGLYATSNPDRTGPVRGQRWVVNAYPQAVRQAFGCDVDSIPWGKRVRDPAAMDFIEVNAVTDQLDRLLATPPAERLSP